MAFTIYDDYVERSRADNMEVLTRNNSNPDKLIADIEVGVRQEIGSYVNARYDMSTVYPDVIYWQSNTAYIISNLIYIKGILFVLANTTPAGTIVTDGTTAYLTLLDATNQPLDNATYFTPIGLNQTYYLCIQAAPIGTLLSNAAFFNEGDTRITKLKEIVIDLVLYRLYKTVNPRAVPEFIIEDKDHTITYLEKIANPRNNINADYLPLITYTDPTKSNNISWGSLPRVITNKY